MNNRVLMVASVPSMIGQFNMDNIQILLGMGYKVDVACDFSDMSVWPKAKVMSLKKQMEESGVLCLQVDFSRSPLSIKRHLNAYKKIVRLLKENDYEFIHTHTPIASAIARLAAKKTHTKVIYTAHGFHFYHGAPLKNWVLFYPIEKYLSRYTDILITINKEDYNRAKEKFKSSQIFYVPGIGVDIEKINMCCVDIEHKRTELGLKENDIMLLSVGELSERKNHEAVIRALKVLNNDKIKYFIVGKGQLKEYLENLISDMNLQNQVTLLGFRTDVLELCKSADIFIFPSLQEGLPVALMEAMACKTIVLCSAIRGNTDLINKYEYIFNQDDYNDIVLKMKNIIGERTREEILKIYSKQIEDNYRKLEAFDKREVKKRMENIYLSLTIENKEY